MDGWTLRLHGAILLALEGNTTPAANVCALHHKEHQVINDGKQLDSSWNGKSSHIRCEQSDIVAVFVHNFRGASQRTLWWPWTFQARRAEWLRTRLRRCRWPWRRASRGGWAHTWSLQRKARRFSKSEVELRFLSSAEEELSPSEHPRESLHVTELSVKHR